MGIFNFSQPHKRNLSLFCIGLNLPFDLALPFTFNDISILVSVSKYFRVRLLNIETLDTNVNNLPSLVGLFQ